MKLWKKTTALVLALGMSLSVTACGDPDESSSGNGGNAPKTEAEIFDYVIDAMQASKAYTGDITGTLTLLSTEKESDGTEEGTEVFTEKSMEMISYDATNGVQYVEGYDEDEDGRDEGVEKTFVQDGKLYEYNKYTFTPSATNTEDEAETEENYVQYVNQARREMAVDPADYMEFESIEGWAIAEDVTEWKNAYDTVAAAQKTVMSAEMPEGATLDVSLIATATGENGVYTLKVATSMSSSMSQEGVTMQQVMESEILASAKDGKIVAIAQNMTRAQETKMTVGTETTTSIREYTSNMGITYSYAFEKAKYDALSVSLPTNAEEITVRGDDYDDSTFTVYVNGVEFGGVDCDYDATTAQEAANSLGQSVLSRMGVSLSEFGTKLTTFKVYEDAAMTKELDPATITDEKYFALDEIYVKVEAAEGYALVWEKEESRYDLSKAYQIALSYGGWDNTPELSVVAVGETFTFRSNEYDPIDEIYVNGTKQESTATGFTVSESKSYEVKYVNVRTDEDMLG